MATQPCVAGNQQCSIQSEHHGQSWVKLLTSTDCVPKHGTMCNALDGATGRVRTGP